MAREAKQRPNRWHTPMLAWLVAVFTLGAAHADAPGGALSPLDAVNVAGRERMLSQRATKAWLLVGQGVTTASARAILADSTTRFESQLAALERMPADTEIAAARTTLAASWHDMKPLLDAAPTPGGAQALYDANEAVQKAAHQLTLACERRAPAPVAHLVNLAGRQRMLSQRLAKFFLYRTWDVSADAADMELELAHAHFNAVLIQLEKSTLIGAATRAEIAALRSAWRDYEPLLTARTSVQTMQVNRAAVAQASEAVLEKTERVVGTIVAGGATP